MSLQLFKIASTTVETPQANVDFTSIPQGYTDLLVVLSGRSDGAAYNNLLRFNNDSGSNYTWRNLYAFSGSVYSDAGTASPENTYIRFGFTNASTMTTSAFGSAQAYIPNYASSLYKSVGTDGTQESNATTGVDIGFTAGLWSSTSAINRVTITPQAGQFVAGTTATLYGVL